MKNLTTQRFAVANTEFNSNKTAYLMIVNAGSSDLSFSLGENNGVAAQAIPLPVGGHFAMPGGYVYNFTIHGTGDVGFVTAVKITAA